LFHIESIGSEIFVRLTQLSEQFNGTIEARLSSSLDEQWKPPREGRIKHSFNSAPKGNPRRSGSGGVLRYNNGNMKAIFMENIGIKSNKQAKMEALIGGIKIS
jgi:hypothetical protein